MPITAKYGNIYNGAYLYARSRMLIEGINSGVYIRNVINIALVYTLLSVDSGFEA